MEEVFYCLYWVVIGRERVYVVKSFFIDDSNRLDVVREGYVKIDFLEFK